jgi:hypothetical protein
MWTIVVPLLIYWLVMFVLSYIAVEIGQDQLYDEVTPKSGLKVAGGSFLLAAMLTLFRHKGLPATFESMFTDNLIWTVLQALVWIGVFLFIYQFHPWHALAIALPLMLISSGFATMGVDSVTKPAPAMRAASKLNTSQPIRKSMGPAVQPKAAEAK